MASEDFVVVLLPDTDEGNFQTPAVQDDFQKVLGGIKAANVPVKPQIIVQKSADGGMWLIGEFAVPLAAASAPIWTLLGVWIQARYGRKVRLKVGDIEAEASTVADIEKLMKIAKPAKADDA